MSYSNLPFPRYLQSSSKTTAYFSWASFSPADSTTYRPSPLGDASAASTSASKAYQIKLEKNASSFGIHIVTARGTAPTSELVTVRLSNITKGTTVDFGTFEMATLNVDSLYFSAVLDSTKDDLLEIQFVTPAWVTNPATWRVGCMLTY